MTTQKRMEFLKLILTEELVAMMVEDTGCPIEEAFSMLFKSQTYARLSNPRTKLYTQSAGYLYSMFKDEMKENANGNVNLRSAHRDACVEERSKNKNESFSVLKA